ncbi:MAG: prephenate dehydrogenase/arogenate dehydrogenase family protein, partial [Burkholderiales bacterium]|nr:prephenate dehydrogenase/arogenate dehydrogenase family protein [Burkholderiales bacterium]
MEKINRLLVVGLGLIGGSFALALKRAGQVTQVVGWDRSPAVMQRALELGIIDQVPASLAEAMQGTELVMLAVPVAQTAATLASLLPYVEAQTTITDSGSTKQDVIAAAHS